MAEYLQLPEGLLKLDPSYFTEPKPAEPKPSGTVNPTCPCGNPGATTITPLDGTNPYKICGECLENHMRKSHLNTT